MEFISEFILELIFEGTIEVSKNGKVPKFIRYPLIIIIALFFIAVIALIFLVGFLTLTENIFLGIFFVSIGLLMFIMSIVKFKKTYLIKINKARLR